MQSNLIYSAGGLCHRAVDTYVGDHITWKIICAACGEILWLSEIDLDKWPEYRSSPVLDDLVPRTEVTCLLCLAEEWL
jgi:ribosomal protein S27E